MIPRREGSATRRAVFWIAATLWVLSSEVAGPLARAAESEQAPTIEVDGLGWWRNRQVRVNLERLVVAGQTGSLDANALDDAAFILIDYLLRNGYPDGRVSIAVESPDGSAEQQFAFDSSLDAAWPRDIRAQRLRFEVAPGLWYHVGEVSFSGLSAIPADTASLFFRSERLLFDRAGRAYSEEQIARGRANLEAELRQRGFADAEVAQPHVVIDEASGDVNLEVEVAEGPLWTVRSLSISEDGVRAAATGDLGSYVGLPWSPIWQQNVAAAIRRANFASGHPDVEIGFVPVATAAGAQTLVDVAAVVSPGAQVRVGEIRFEGANRTRLPVLRRRVEAEPGDLLDPQALEQARFRLARLGIFEGVDLRYEPDTGPVRSPVFAVREGRTLEVNLLAGYGSYEELRGGAEVRQYNLFGRAHQSRLQLLQSMKSSRFDYAYTVPELFGERVDGTARLFGLQRQEFSFVRQEYGGSLLLKWPAAWIGADATASYTFQALRNIDNALSTSAVDDKQLVVASLEASLVRDRRDNPLRPREGYRLFAQLEAADRRLGGEVVYQRFEIGGAYHRRVGEGRWIHAGLDHGFILTLGSDDSSLPVNKRFFPGGDGSIRGYREGEAAPRGADGRFVGAKAMLLASVEFEQALSRNFSAVMFVDGLGTAATLADYPFDQKLYSGGLGLRYHTIVGPIRAEYGRNFNRREGDPTGTWLISVGTPF